MDNSDEELRQLYDNVARSVSVDALEQLRNARAAWMRSLDEMGRLKPEELTAGEFAHHQQIAAGEAIRLLCSFPAIIRFADLAGLNFSDLDQVRQHLIEFLGHAPSPPEKT